MEPKKVTEKTVQSIIEKYSKGDSIYRIAKDTKLNSATIKRWLRNSGIPIRKTKYDYSNKRKKEKIDEKKLIYLYVVEKKSINDLVKILSLKKLNIKYYLEKNNVKLREKNNHKECFTEEEKREIIRLYAEEKRGAKYIGGLFDRSDGSITYWLNKWKVSKNSRSEISKKIREVYGVTKGFSGRKHSKKSRIQISKSGLEAWDKLNRIPTIGKSRTFKTKIGKVLGSYEVAYIQKLINENKDLPKPNKKKIKTPFGYYTPDFEFANKFIEVKSRFTLSVCKGEIPTAEGVYSDNQWKKIQWTSKNVKKVDIVVLNKKQAFNLFSQAINDNFVLDKVEIKNNQYKIL